MTQSRDTRIHTLLTDNMHPVILNIINESHKHKHHSGDNGTLETHYDITIISSSFEGISKINRHRMVTDLLNDEFKTGLHALSLNLKTPAEWEKTNPKSGL